MNPLLLTALALPIYILIKRKPAAAASVPVQTNPVAPAPQDLHKLLAPIDLPLPSPNDFVSSPPSDVNAVGPFDPMSAPLFGIDSVDWKSIAVPALVVGGLFFAVKKGHLSLGGISRRRRRRRA